MSKIQVTCDVSLSPDQLAQIFAQMCHEEQAAFLNEVGYIARSWPNGGWCVQACSIAPLLTPDGLTIAAKIVEHRAAF